MEMCELVLWFALFNQQFMISGFCTLQILFFYFFWLWFLRVLSRLILLNVLLQYSGQCAMCWKDPDFTYNFSNVDDGCL